MSGFPESKIRIGLFYNLYLGGVEISILNAQKRENKTKQKHILAMSRCISAL